MGVIRFDIRHANAQRESLVIEGERALIGSASHCDVRLPVDQAAHEHLLVEVFGTTLRAQAKVEDRPPTLDGVPFSAATLTPDSVLGIGNVRLFVSFAPDASDTDRAVLKRRTDSNPWLAGALALGFVGAGYWMLSEGEAPIDPAPAAATELFMGKPPSCPEQDPTRANALGEERLDVAHGKRERMPFAVEEGVAAVALYQISSACFMVGGLPGKAREADSAASSLKQRLQDEFRARRLRLSHTLRVEDFELAEVDVRALRALTAGQRGAYVDWLASVARRLEQKGVE